MDSPRTWLPQVGGVSYLSGGLVAGDHSGGFASMLQYVAAGATWSQKSRVGWVGRQACSFSPTSTANSKMAT